MPLEEDFTIADIANKKIIHLTKILPGWVTWDMLLDQLFSWVTGMTQSSNGNVGFMS